MRLRWANNILTIYQYEKPIYVNKEKKNNITSVVKKDRLEILKTNMHAKKDRFIDLVNANLVGTCYMVTLTYNAENVHYLSNLTASHYNFNLFIKNLKYNCFKDKELKYVCRWELQKETGRNALHYHIIIFNTDIKRFNLDLLRKLWGRGSVNVKRIYKKTSGIGKYLAKYLAQDLDDFVSNKKSYFSSKNLIRPYNIGVLDWDKKNNLLTLETGEIIDLTKYTTEKTEQYESFYNGKTKKITLNKQN